MTSASLMQRGHERARPADGAQIHRLVLGHGGFHLVVALALADHGFQPAGDEVGA
jgi:hypothetical protein